MNDECFDKRWRMDYQNQQGEMEKMMDQKSTARSITRSVTIERDPEGVYRFLSNLANWPRWAIVNVKVVSPRDDGWWDLTTPLGSGKLRLRTNPELGILDHDFVGPDASWTVPARVVPNGIGSEFMMTFFQPPALPGDIFDAQIALLDVELAKLKEILEGSDADTAG